MSMRDVRRDAAPVLPVSLQGSLLCQRRSGHGGIELLLLSTYFPHSPDVTWVVKTEVKAVSASVAVIHTNFIYFPPYPAIPYSK